MIDFRDLTKKELEEYITKINEQKFRANQLFEWIHKGVNTFDEILNINKSLKEKLKNDGYICNMEIEAKFESKYDNTIKYVMKLKDGNYIECVLMRYSFGNTICISTQAGCSMGCSFCASAIGGKIRNLTAGEMLGQVLTVQNDSKQKISNVVLMGTGEPLDNYDNVIKFLNIINDSSGINIGMRHITISTCGLVPQIKSLADLNFQLTLAISLHAPNDEIRKIIMPIANKYSMEELLDACRYYIKVTNRRITFEYALISGVNDSDENAFELCEKLKGMLCHVNLIPLNRVEGKRFIKPDKNRINTFKDILQSKGIETTVRREMGNDIDAACGQLRRRFIEKVSVGGYMLIECRTDKGKVRDINEDYIMVFKTNKYSLIIVADGMGGHNAGEIASKLACITIRDFISQNYNTYDNNEELIRDALLKANNLVYEESQNNVNFSGMGTTITCCLISNDELYLGHVGDSRAYIVNENGIKKLTEDHSYVQELINNGSITENEAVSHPQRNLITRAIGTEKYVVVDTKHETIKEEDYIILCTDGLTSYLSNDEIKDLIIEYGLLAVDKLINIANDRGGYDNISVIVAKRGDEK